MLSTFKKKISQIKKNAFQHKKVVHKHKKNLRSFAKKRPLTTFFMLLAVLLCVIALGNLLRQPDILEESVVSEPKKVATYVIGEAPRISVTAEVEKSGVVTIVAQTSGVVQTIYCREGEEFGHGQTLVGLSTNYQGGNALTVQRQIAARQYQEAVDTFDLQKEIIEKQRTIATNTDRNDDELREITERSIDETRSLIELNESNIDLIDELIEITENASEPTTTAEKEKISALKQQKSGLLNGLNSAKSALRQAEYSTDEENPPTTLSNVSEELTIKQLKLQERTLGLNKEISLLQLRLAQINEALMFPASPFNGRIERVHVRQGQVVNPGDPIATISGTKNTLTAVAYVSENVARNISQLEQSRVYVGNQVIEAQPTYVAQEPTNGRLFAVLFHLPETLNDVVVEGEVITIDIPVGYAQTSAIRPFIPIDSVFQTSDAAYVYVDENGLAESREVQLGNLFGSFVEVTSGLSVSDRVILDRTVSQGEPVIGTETE